MYVTNHPNSLIQGIPPGQFLRIKEKCPLCTGDLGSEAIHIRYWKGQGKKALSTERNRLLSKWELHQKEGERKRGPIRFITKCGLQWEEVRSIMKRNWHVLTSSPQLAHIWWHLGLTSWGNLLVQSEFTKKTLDRWPPRTYPCGHCTVFANANGSRLEHTTLKILSIVLHAGSFTPVRNIFIGKTTAGPNWRAPSTINIKKKQKNPGKER